MTYTIQGERWFPEENAFTDDMDVVWGDWYCDSEVGTLRAVLLHRPGPEIEGITQDNFAEYRFRAPIDAVKAREQQDALAEVYRNNGVTVHYVEGQRSDRPNAMYVRDLMVMTPNGAIVCRPGIPARRGEEQAVHRTLLKLGVPVAKTINGDGFFEGACALWVDRNTCIVGSGSRSNQAGVEQVSRELSTMGVENVIHAQIPYGSIHLDGYISFVDRRKALIFPWHTTYDTMKPLLDMGFELIEAGDIEEVKQGMGLNTVALAPGTVVMPAGNPGIRSQLEGAGVEVIAVELDEIMNGWGSIHCMTGFLKRDPIQ